MKSQTTTGRISPHLIGIARVVGVSVITLCIAYILHGYSNWLVARSILAQLGTPLPMRLGVDWHLNVFVVSTEHPYAFIATTLVLYLLVGRQVMAADIATKRGLVLSCVSVVFVLALTWIYYQENLRWLYASPGIISSAK